jgi:hypothetical protein
LGPTSRATSSASMAWSTCRPVPTARPATLRGRRWPIRPRRRSPARASPAGHGRSWWCAGYPSARRSPSGRATWRLPDTYHRAGLRRGPPPQLLREPGQPPARFRHPSAELRVAGIVGLIGLGVGLWVVGLVGAGVLGRLRRVRRQGETRPDRGRIRFGVGWPLIIPMIIQTILLYPSGAV